MLMCISLLLQHHPTVMVHKPLGSNNNFILINKKTITKSLLGKHEEGVATQASVGSRQKKRVFL